MLATVKYQIATYSGTINVNCSEDDEDTQIVAKAKTRLRKQSGEFPFGYQSFKIISKESNHEDKRQS